MIETAIRIASQFAPGLVRRLAGERAGDVAQQIVNMGRSVLGLPTASPEEVAQRLEEDAAKAHEFRMRAAELEVELEQAFLADRQSARDMRLELAKLGKTDWMMYGVAGVTVTGLVVTVLAIFFAPDLTERQTALLNVMGGGLLAGFMSIISYFFGSSRGSSNKTLLMSLGQPNERQGS